MKILLTGNLGYVGPVVVRHLREALPDAKLVGFDSAFFALPATEAGRPSEGLPDVQHFGDVRDIPHGLLEGVDAVVHLAAVSNDPMGKRFERVTGDINYGASLNLARKAGQAGVSHFVFASSCSVYGFAPGAARKETDPLNPQTAYARSKVDTEKGLAALDTGMTVTCLRFATACGASDRLRLDLVLNDFVACALAKGEILVLSDGTPWRPLIDVRDMARAMAWAARRDARDGGRVLSVNVGSDACNYQVRELADAVAAEIPGTAVRINDGALPDSRSYKVDFSLFSDLAGNSQPQVTLQQSIQGVARQLRSVGFSRCDYGHPSYVRLKTLEGHIDAGRLTEDLRWCRQAAEGDLAAGRLPAEAGADA